MDFENYYEILNLTHEATEAEISSSFKKLAKKYHPDKTKESKAKEKYLQIGKAYEILSDEKAKKAFDAVLKSKINSSKRTSEMSASRRSMQEDLEARENFAKKQKTNEEEARKNLQREIERLRSQNLERKKQEEERKRKENSQEKSGKGEIENQVDMTINLFWNQSEFIDYSYDRLKQIFQMFGEIDDLSFISEGKENLESKEKESKKEKKEKAFLRYKSSSSALHLMGELPGTTKPNLGDSSNPLEFKWKLNRNDSKGTKNSIGTKKSIETIVFSEDSEKDLLLAMAKAQQRKNTEKSQT